ncbi:hypothetical protein DICA2_E13498 [Diutina catenulata]
MDAMKRDEFITVTLKVTGTTATTINESSMDTTVTLTKTITSSIASSDASGISSHASSDVTSSLASSAKISASHTQSSLSSHTAASKSASVASASASISPYDFLPVESSKPNNALRNGLSVGIPLAILVIALGVILYRAHRHHDNNLGSLLKLYTSRKKDPPSEASSPTEPRGPLPTSSFGPALDTGRLASRSTLALPKPRVAESSSVYPSVYQESRNPYQDTFTSSATLQDPFQTPAKVEPGPQRTATIARDQVRMSTLAKLQEASDAASDVAMSFLSPIFHTKKFSLRGPPERDIDLTDLTPRKAPKSSYNPFVNMVSEPVSPLTQPKPGLMLNLKVVGENSGASTPTVETRSTRNVRLNEFVVVRSYTRSLDDELSIRVGDHVKVHHDFPDGWSSVSITKYAAETVARPSHRSRGVVPSICLHRI